MRHFSIQKQVGLYGTVSKRAAEVMRLFGLDRRDLERHLTRCSCELEIGPGQICLITGPSGTGKTLLLRELFESLAEEERIRLDDIPLERNASVIDCIEGPVWEALRMLCRAGLSDVFTVLNCPGRLSEGQKYRYRLARALLSRKRYIFADEFGSLLERTGAHILAFQIRRIISENGRVFFAASCREDLAVPLLPDVIVRKDLGRKTEILYPQKNRLRIC